MTEERFEKLAAAYGGDITRWPEAARDAAALFLAARPDVAGAVLAREDRLDAALDALPRSPASAELFERVVASAPAGRATGRAARRPAWRGWLLPAGFSLSLAAATAAGVLLGAQVGARTGLTSDAGAMTAELDVSGLAGDV